MSAPLVQSIVSGILLGSIYAMMAMGLTLIYGALRMLNLSHGVLFMIGGYVAWVVVTSWGLHPLIGLAAAFILVFAMGVAMQRAVVKPLLGKPGWEINTIIATLGLSIVLENAILLTFGPRQKSLPPMVSGSFALPNGVVITFHEIVIAVVAVGSLVAMALFLSRTRHGLAIQATAQNREAAYLMGVNVHQIFALILGVSSGLAATSGVLLTAFYFLSPTVGGIPQLKALLVTIFGGLGSVKGTVYAAYIIGLLEALVSLYIGAKWALPFLFVFMIVVLIVRPNGLFGLGEEIRL